MSHCSKRDGPATTRGQSMLSFWYDLNSWPPTTRDAPTVVVYEIMELNAALVVRLRLRSEKKIV